MTEEASNDKKEVRLSDAALRASATCLARWRKDNNLPDFSDLAEIQLGDEEKSP